MLSILRQEYCCTDIKQVAYYGYFFMGESFKDYIVSKVKTKLADEDWTQEFDEAHNISHKTRGLTLELLMANIKNDCEKANFLLLTPFVPNRNDIARWLDQDSPKSISISLTWKPNDRVIGAIYPEGSGKSWNAVFETLLTSNERIQLEKKIAISKESPLDITRSSLTKGLLCVATAKTFSDRSGILLVCQSPTDCWTVADKLFDETVDIPTDEDVDLVKNYISSELGSDFKLICLLDRRIGVHHSEAELFLRRTYGYSHCSREKQVVVLEAVKKYGQKLNENKGLAKLSDSTGFSFETIKATIGKANSLGINNAVWSGSKLFSANSSLKDLMGIMLSIPEIPNNLEDIGPSGRVVTGDTLANITVDWVSGHDIESIATKYFGGNSEKALTDCCRAIFSKLLNTATWGLASLQKVPSIGVDFDKLPPEEQLRLKNLPAMIYYGVNTNEAILMRINNVPRSIAASLGNKLKATLNDIYKVSLSQAQKWLNELPESEWNSSVTAQKAVNGGDYKRIWKILNGEA